MPTSKSEQWFHNSEHRLQRGMGNMVAVPLTRQAFDTLVEAGSVSTNVFYFVRNEDGSTEWFTCSSEGKPVSLHNQEITVDIDKESLVDTDLKEAAKELLRQLEENHKPRVQDISDYLKVFCQSILASPDLLESEADSVPSLQEKAEDKE